VWLVLVLFVQVTGVASQSLSRNETEGSRHAGDPAALFRTGVDLVTLNVVVTNGQHHPLPRLAAEAFDATEDGVAQDVSYFASEDVPLDLAVLIDTSSSMGARMPALRMAAVRFLDVIRPGDRVTVVGVGISAAPGVRELVPPRAASTGPPTRGRDAQLRRRCVPARGRALTREAQRTGRSLRVRCRY